MNLTAKVSGLDGPSRRRQAPPAALGSVCCLCLSLQVSSITGHSSFCSAIASRGAAAAARAGQLCGRGHQGVPWAGHLLSARFARPLEFWVTSLALLGSKPHPLRHAPVGALTWPLKRNKPGPHAAHRPVSHVSTAGALLAPLSTRPRAVDAQRGTPPLCPACCAAADGQEQGVGQGQPGGQVCGRPG